MVFIIVLVFTAFVAHGCGEESAMRNVIKGCRQGCVGEQNFDERVLITKDGRILWKEMI